MVLQKKNKNFKTNGQVIAFILAMFFAVGASAVNESPQTFSLDGQLFQSGTIIPLTDNAVKLTVQVVAPNANCLLYEEEQVVDTRSTEGRFTIHVGSVLGSTKRTVNDPGRNMVQIFQNTSGIVANSVPGQTCAGGVYTPAPGAVRYFRLIVTPSSTNVPDTLTPDIVIDSVPSALVAQSVQGLEKTNILQVNNTAPVALSQVNLEALFTTPAYANLQSILAGNFMRQDSSGASLPSYAATPGGVSTGDMWYDSTTNQVKYQSDSGVQTIGTSTGGISSLTMSSDLSVNGSAAGTISGGSGTIGLSNTGVTAGSYTKVTVDAKGRVTAGASLSESDLPTISTAGKVSGNAITSGTISGSTTVNTSGNLITTGTISGLTVQATNLRIYNGAHYVQLTAQAMSSDLSFALPTADGISGQVLQTNGAGVLSWGAATTAGTISVGQGGTGTTSYANNQLIASNGTGTALVATTCPQYQVISFDASGNITCSNVSSLAGMILNGGNSTAGTISIGTNDNQALQLKANNTIAMTISQNGNVGIGTIDPATSLDIIGGSATQLRLSNTSTNVTNKLSYISQRHYTNAEEDVSLFVGTSSSAASTIRYGGGSGSLNAVTELQFYTAANNTTLSGTQRMTIDSSGNVGIGTTSPTTALDVSGALTARGMSSAPSVSGSNTGRIYYDFSANKFKVSQNGAAYVDLVSAGGGGSATGVSAAAGTVSGPSISFSGDGDSGFYSNGANTVGVTAGGTNTFNFNQTSLSSPTNGGAYLTTANGTSLAPTYSFAGDTDTGWFSPAANTLAAATNGAERIRIDSSGNLGVGTTSPALPVDIVTTVSTGATHPNRAGLRVSSEGSSVGARIQSTYAGSVDAPQFVGTRSRGTLSSPSVVQSGDALNYLSGLGYTGLGWYGAANVGFLTTENWSGSSGGAGIVFNTTSNGTLVSSERMRVDHNGNVGIGTTSPDNSGITASTLLHVAGSVTNRGMINLGSGSGVSGGPVSTLLSSSGTSRIAQIDVNTDAGFSDRGSMQFYTSPSGGSTVSRMLISSSGNVGIGTGTTTPSSKLEVASDSATGMTVSTYEGSASWNTSVLSLRRATGTGGSPGVVNVGNELGRVDFFGRTSSGWALAGQIKSYNDSVAGGSTLNGAIEFLTGAIGSSVPISRLLINSAGNVGIGTTSPTTALEISGALTARGMSSAPSVSASNTGRIYYDYSANKFKVSQNGAAYVDLISGGGAGDIMNGGNTSGADITIGTNDNKALKLEVNNSTAMTVSQNGNVGIGTSNPTQLLEVRKDQDAATSIRVSNSSVGTNARLRFELADGVTNKGLISYLPADNSMYISNSQAGAMFLQTNAADRITITASGNVGIGTGGPGYKLDVNGDTNIASGSALRFGGTSVCTSAGCTSSSDRNLKENIQPLEGSLEKVLSLQGVEYDYRDKVRFTAQHQIGVIAQDVERVYPEVVSTDPQSGLKAVAYDHLVAPLIEAVKSLYKRLLGVESQMMAQDQVITNKADQAEVNQLKAEVASKDQKIKELERRLEKIENFIKTSELN